MKRLIFEIVVLVFLTALLFSCSASMPAKKPIENIIPASAAIAEKTRLIKGEIDFIKEAEFFSNGEAEMMVTLIGFKSGEGAMVMGIHPGLKEGKKVKIYIEKSNKIYKGASLYEIKRIESSE